MAEPKTILVIDDDQDIRDSLKEVLELEGYRVSCAANGKTGLEALSAPGFRPDLILLDWMMPVMNGETFMKERESRPDIKSIPVIVFSATGKRVEEVSAAQFMGKPVELDLLIQTVSNILAN